MKFLLCFSLIFLLNSIKTFHLQKESESNFILKLNENFYDKIGHSRIDEFKNMIFRELDQKTNILDRNLNSLSAVSNKTLNEISKSKQDEIFRSIAGDYVSSNRVIKFYISHASECSIFVNDTVMYKNINNVNFVEHMILHNNAENIDPKGVYSEDVNINFFAFNKKLNIFSVYFEDRKNANILKTTNSTSKYKNFSIEYDYEALNIIKSNLVKDMDAAINNQNDTILVSSNTFIWKILNQNLIKSKENVTIEIYFDLGKEFEHEDVEFSLNFTKSIINTEKKSLIKYIWKGSIDPQEVVILQAKFPLYFEHCGNISINIVMIFVGAIFIIFLIGMLYVILSTVFSDDIF
jgi:hypothetical protein